MPRTKAHKYRMVIKTNDPNVGSDDSGFIKLHESDLLSMTAYLNRRYPKWGYMKVFNASNGNFIDEFTRAKPPKSKIIS